MIMDSLCIPVPYPSWKFETIPDKVTLASGTPFHGLILIWNPSNLHSKGIICILQIINKKRFRLKAEEENLIAHFVFLISSCWFWTLLTLRSSFLIFASCSLIASVSDLISKASDNSFIECDCKTINIDFNIVFEIYRVVERSYCSLYFTARF